MEQHVLLVISNDPIVHAVNPDSVRHLISTKIEINDSPGGWTIASSIPSDCKYDPQHKEIVEANGSTLSIVILNWLLRVYSSLAYYPIYLQRKYIEDKKG